MSRIKPEIPDWRPAAKRIAGAIAAVAAVGAVLSGLTGYWSTYKTVVGDWLGQKPGITQTAPRGFATAPPRLSIAVMPFTNLSGDVSHDYFGDGLVDNLTTSLSTQLRGLLVIDRGSAFTYKGKATSAKQIGTELRVRYIVQGSLLRASNNQIRINAQLIDTETAAQLWAERFDGESTDLLKLQDQFTARIANSLGIAMIQAQARLAEKRKTNPEAIDLIFKARMLQRTGARSVAKLGEAADLYRAALKIDPNEAEAMIFLANALTVRLSNFRSMPAEQRRAEIAEAHQMVDQGLAIQPDSVEGHNSKGRLLALEGRWREAIIEHELARQLDPNYVNNLNRLAVAYVRVGQLDKAIEIEHECFDRSPNDPVRGVWYLVLGSIYALKSEPDKALELLFKAKPLIDDFNNIHVWFAAAYAQKGQMEEARASIREAIKADPTLSLERLQTDPNSREKNFQPYWERHVATLKSAGLRENAE